MLKAKLLLLSAIICLQLLNLRNEVNLEDGNNIDQSIETSDLTSRS